LLPDRITSLPVVLRTFVPADAARVEELCGDPAVALTTATIPYPYPQGAAVSWIATHANQRDAGTAWTYAITHVDGNLLLGAIDLRTTADGDGLLGYWIGRQYWGRGYATLAVRALIAMAFLGLDVDALSATHLSRNAASGRVLEKCRLTLTRRERKPHRDGSEEEICLWSITRERWATLRAA
jgi:[ribosomal protein S5]-alanine N-acetyltransferase